MRSLSERGHRLWGLWSRSMAWDQGPYPVTDGCIRPIALADAAQTIRDEKIDCVYSLFQVYEARRWGPPAPGVDHDIWTLLRALLLERQRGAFDVPFIRHWGYDVHHVDSEVVRAFDAQIFCNREQHVRWTLPVADGGLGLDFFSECRVVEFFDSDRPKLEFMNDQFTESLSGRTGEIHTVCAGRPLGIDFAALARQGIHVHIYGNDYDDVARGVARNLSARSRVPTQLLSRFVHLHPPVQTIGMAWRDAQSVKARWVPEFSRYDAGWSYIGDLIPGVPLEDGAAVPNRLGTYLLAGLPVVTDRRPGAFRYDEVSRLGVNIDLVDGDYAALREALEAETRTRRARGRAIEQRHGYSFDATIDRLIHVLGRACEAYASRPRSERTRFASNGEPRLVWLGARTRTSLLAGSAKRTVRRRLTSLRARRLDRVLKRQGERS